MKKYTFLLVFILTGILPTVSMHASSADKAYAESVEYAVKVEGVSPLAVAIRSKNPNAVANLIAKGELNANNINTPILLFKTHPEKRAPLGWALEANNVDVIRELLKVPNIDTMVRVHSVYPPVIYAVFHSNQPLFELLLKAGVDLGAHTLDRDKKTLGSYLATAPDMQKVYDQYASTITPIINDLVLHNIFRKKSLTFKQAWEEADSNANKVAVLEKALGALVADKTIANKRQALRAIEVYVNGLDLLPYLHEELTARIRKLKDTLFASIS